MGGILDPKGFLYLLGSHPKRFSFLSDLVGLLIFGIFLDPKVF